MIFCRFTTEEKTKYGIFKNHRVQEISPNPFSDFEEIGNAIPLSQLRLLAPVLPSKIIATGLNYRKHAEEMKLAIPQEPIIFLKPASSVIGPEETILYPEMSAQVDYEAELAAVIKKKTKNVSLENAEDCILGYTCFNDVTARDLQKKDGQWTRAKSFDTFSPIGPWIVSDLDTSDLHIEAYLNRKLRQDGRTSDMIFNVSFLVSFISRIMTLEPGDVITTGTPPGIGPMKPGDVIDVRIEGIGILKNVVRKELSC